MKPLSAIITRYVNCTRGSDVADADGSSSRPWRTISYALTRLAYYTGTGSIILVVTANEGTNTTLNTNDGKLPTVYANISIDIRLQNVNLMLQRIVLAHGRIRFSALNDAYPPTITFDKVAAGNNAVIDIGFNGYLTFNNVNVVFDTCSTTDAGLLRADAGGYIYISTMCTLNIKNCTGRVLVASMGGHVSSGVPAEKFTGRATADYIALATYGGRVVVRGMTLSVASGTTVLYAFRGGQVAVDDITSTYLKITGSNVTTFKAINGGIIFHGKYELQIVGDVIR